MGTLRNRKCSRRPFISRLFGRTRTEKGQALVELALTFPILVMLFVGAAEFARVVYASIEVSNAAMAGVSYGAQTPPPPATQRGFRTPFRTMRWISRWAPQLYRNPAFAPMERLDLRADGLLHLQY